MKLEIFGPFKARYGKLLREARLLSTVFDTVPSALVILDEDMCVQFANRLFLNLVHPDQNNDLCGRSFGELVGCVCPECLVETAGTRCPGAHCSRCSIRPAFDALIRGEQQILERDIVIARGDEADGLDLRMRAALLVLENTRHVLVSLLDLSDVRSLERQLQAKNAELEEMLEQVRTLEALLPMCVECKKVRDTKHYWQSVEEYLHENVGTVVTHGLCPDCLSKLYPDEAARMEAADDPS